MASIASFGTYTHATGDPTNLIMSAINGAGGDGSIALWRATGTNPVFTYPTVSMMARANKARNARHFEIRGVVPWARQSADTGLFQLVSKATFFTTIVLPDNAPLWVHQDVVSLLANSVGTQFTQIASGYAPG